MAKTQRVEFSDEQYDLPKLNFGQIEQIMPLLPGLSDPQTSITAMLDVMQVTIEEAYPEVVIRKLPLDFNGMRVAFTAVMKFSGMEMTGSGEAKARATTIARKSAGV
jgi:hypothetical protein